MEDVEIESNRFTIVQSDPKSKEFDACHDYYISPIGADVAGEFGVVKFQRGPIKEHGVNGCHHEDLLAIVIHRLQSFQAGKFSCRENAIAITKLEEAMHWLNHRTASREKRGVEGTSNQ